MKKIIKTVFKWLSFTYISFICFGFIGVGAYEIARSYNITKNYNKGTGTIIGGEHVQQTIGNKKTTSFVPNVMFTGQDSKIYVFKGDPSWYRYNQGDQVPIYYQPENPFNGIVYHSLDFFIAPSIFLTLGLLGFILFTYIIFFKKQNTHRIGSRERDIQTNWTKINGTFLKDTPIRKYGPKGEEYYIQAEAFDTIKNEQRIFTSDPIEYNPSVDIASAKEIAIYINPNNPEEYWMDFEDMW